MKIRVVIEANDVVRRAQKDGRQLDYKVAEAALRKFEDTIMRSLEDLKKRLVDNVVEYAIHGERVKHG